MTRLQRDAAARAQVPVPAPKSISALAPPEVTCAKRVEIAGWIDRLAVVASDVGRVETLSTSERDLVQ